MSAAPTPVSAHAQAVQRMMWYFAIVYIAEGWAQTSGIIHQPLLKFLDETMHWNSDQIGGYLWWLGIPWWIKPIYGLFSDSLPIAGYRRKSYLLLANLVAVFAYLGLWLSDSPGPMLPCLILIVMAMAFSSALCGALIVERAKHAHEDNHTWQRVVRSNVTTLGAAGTGGWLFQYYVPLDALPNAHFLVLGGEMMGGLLVVSAGFSVGSALYKQFVLSHGQQASIASKFCGQQSLWANIATVIAAFIAGWLCQRLLPLEALHTAALWAIPAPLLVVLTTWPLVQEEKASTDMQHFRDGLAAIGRALRTKELWAVAGFLALWAFNPGFAPGVMYAHMKHNLHFSDLLVGSLGGYTAIGAACGALLYMRIISHYFSVRTLACTLILLGAGVQASFIFMADPQVAIVLSLLNGALTAMAGINAHVIAANRCPDHAEGFMYASLLSISNLSWSTSGVVGGWLYVNVFHSSNYWLILASAGLTLCCALLLRWLRVERDPAPPHP